MIIDEEVRPGVRFFRTLLRCLVACLYRIEVKGGDHVPRTGPALFVSNHISFADPMVISAATAKPIRFLMWRSIYKSITLGWFFRLMKEIPVSPDDTPRQIAGSLKEARHALKQGDRVGLFAEGAISRFSQIQRFQRGMEVIVRNLDVPIIPTHIDRMWGSIFSFEQGRFFKKVPKLRRLPITISFGSPLPPNTSIHEVRQSVMELGSAAFASRLPERRTLHKTFIRHAKKRWTDPCVLNEKGNTLFSYGEVATTAVLLSQRFRRFFKSDVPVGVLFAASPSRTLAILGLQLAGKIPVPLDPDLSGEKLEALCRCSGVSQILTSRDVHQRTHLNFKSQAVYLDDFPIEPRLKKMAISSMLRFFPQMFGTSVDSAVILFSQPETTDPLPIQVHHDTITACLIGLQEVIALGEKDTVASALPISDPLVFATALWWPLLHGARMKPSGTTIHVEERFVLSSADKAASHNNKDVPFLTTYSSAALPVMCVSALDVIDGSENQRGAKPGTVGRPVPGVCMKILDPITRQKLPPGEPGLLLVKAPTLNKMVNPSLNEEGWLVTGEHAHFDEDGFVTFSAKESLITKTEKNERKTPIEPHEEFVTSS